MKSAGALLTLFAVCLAALAFAYGLEGAPVRGSGDAIRGESLFEKRCTGCHAMDADREGPRLAGVFGRKAGTVAGFEYSAGLKKSGINWDEITLEKWLAGPDSLVPATKMDFHVPVASERLDLIAYLKKQSSQSEP